MELRVMKKLKSGKIIIISVAATVFLASAGGSYYFLSTKNFGNSENSNIISDKLDESSEEALIRKAHDLVKSGQSDLSEGKAEQAVTKLSEAKDIYRDTGEVMLSEQTKDILSLAEHEAAVQGEIELPEAPEIIELDTAP